MATQATTPERVLSTVSSILLACLLAGCLTTKPALLNSERIENQFGSYGIEILSQNDQRRISNLYSNHEAGRICRTLAVVTFHPPIAEAITNEHRTILDGGSIGAEFKSEGWSIRKHHQAVTSLCLDSERSWIARLMHLVPPQELAVHTYQFEVSRDTEVIRYATISEIHHPDYLDARSVRRIYPNLPNGRFPEIDKTLKRALATHPQPAIRTFETH